MGNHNLHGWTDERIERARSLWVDGFSAGMIAAELGITRNATIGKICRLGLQRGGGAEKHKPAVQKPRGYQSHVQPRQGRRGPKWIERPPSAPPSTEIVSNPVTIVELEKHHCRFPLDEPSAQMLYCGAPKVDGLAYCVGHCALAYHPARRIA